MAERGKQGDYERIPKSEGKDLKERVRPSCYLEDLTYFCPRPTPPFVPFPPSTFLLALSIFLCWTIPPKIKAGFRDSPTGTQHHCRSYFSFILLSYRAKHLKNLLHLGFQFCHLLFILQSNPISMVPQLTQLC